MHESARTRLVVVYVHGVLSGFVKYLEKSN